MHDRLIAIAAKRLERGRADARPRIARLSPRFVVCGDRGQFRGAEMRAALFRRGHAPRPLSTVDIDFHPTLASNASFSRESTTMPARFYPFAFLGLIATAGLFACLAADEVHNIVSHDRWKQHDNHRPKPAVVEPAGSPVAAPAPEGRRHSVRWDEPRRLADPRGRAGTLEGGGRVPGGRPGNRTDPDQVAIRGCSTACRVGLAQPTGRQGPGSRQQRHLPHGLV